MAAQQAQGVRAGARAQPGAQTGRAAAQVTALPDELLQAVFSLLASRERVAARQVCRRFRAVLEGPSAAWAEVQAACFRADPAVVHRYWTGLTAFLRPRCPAGGVDVCLSWVPPSRLQAPEPGDMAEYPVSRAWVVLPAALGAALTALAVHTASAWLPCVADAELRLIAAACPNLQSLTVESSSAAGAITAFGVDAVARQLTGLRRLDLGWSAGDLPRAWRTPGLTSLTFMGRVRDLAGLASLARLQELDLVGGRDSTAVTGGEALQRLTSLRTVKLQHLDLAPGAQLPGSLAEFEAVDVPGALRVARGCPTLPALSVQQSGHDWDGLADCLAALSRLESLSLQGPGGMPAEVAAITALSHLCYLGLEFDTVTVPTSLGNLKSLRDLHVRSRAAVFGPGLGLERCEHLTHLAVDDCCRVAICQEATHALTELMRKRGVQVILPLDGADIQSEVHLRELYRCLQEVLEQQLAERPW